MAEQRTLEGYYLTEALWEETRYRQSPLQCLRARTVAALLDPATPSVLDVGCGNGFVTDYLKGNRLVVGCDPSPVALKHASVARVQAGGEALPFGDRAFDSVVCLEVLEHLPRDAFRRTVEELRRVTGRVLIVGVPFRQDLRVGMTRCVACRCRFHLDLHRRSFPEPRSIDKLFPGFGRQGTILLGRHTEKRFRTYQWFRYLLMGPEGRSSLAVCPKCDTPQPSERPEGDGRKLRRRFLRYIDWRIPTRNVPRWMIVLLQRR